MLAELRMASKRVKACARFAGMPWRRNGGACGAVFLTLVTILPAQALPAKVQTIERAQQAGPEITADRRLRVWIIGVGQGDAILIELPLAVSEAQGNPAGDPVNILVDGGATPTTYAKRTSQFLHQLYGPSLTIEHMVMTHHDRDHIVGLTQVLNDPSITVRNVYTSGLASFARGVKGIPLKGNAGGFVGDKNRSLGRFTTKGELDERFRVATMESLQQRVDQEELSSDYAHFAAAVLSKERPQPVESFAQACLGCSSLDAITAPAAGSRPQFRITTVWPLVKPRHYVDWGKTTNGNSVAFRLDYGQFSMLLTGDLNEQSEPDLLSELEAVHKSALLEVDILKVAHHGSRHNDEDFLGALKPMLSVASMGEYGFITSNYKHPDENLLQTLGGPKQFYSTFIHERLFTRSTMSAADFEEMVEDTHVLIESDGVRFRLVEVPRLLDAEVPSVQEVSTGQGTLWIAAE